jgi:F-type H+-transporting ATPase subunit a
VAVLAAGGAEAGGMPDPIHQFELHPIFHVNLGGWDVSFTNSALFMLLSVVLTTLFFMVAMRARALVPGRLQSVAEIAHDFVANMCRESMGKEGMKFFPFVFAIFMFVFVCNTIGIIPGAFTVTSHIVVTAALAVMVFLMVLVVGFAKNGLRFLKLFVPSGVPIYILPLVTLIEVFSFLMRPISHSVRLFANMLAGHITLKVFGGFVVMLLGAGSFAALAPLPLLMAVAITALEVLVAFLQAYVFAILTCMYLNDALHPGGH